VKEERRRQAKGTRRKSHLILFAFQTGHSENCRSPFDTLRANGLGLAIIAHFPFVLSLSKHEQA